MVPLKRWLPTTSELNISSFIKKAWKKTSWLPSSLCFWLDKSLLMLSIWLLISFKLRNTAQGGSVWCSCLWGTFFFYIQLKSDDVMGTITLPQMLIYHVPLSQKSSLLLLSLNYCAAPSSQLWLAIHTFSKELFGKHGFKPLDEYKCLISFIYLYYIESSTALLHFKQQHRP